MNNKNVSVLLTAYNAKERLKLSLCSYNYQTFPKEGFEVIVVDDGSTDNTIELISELKLEFPLKYIRVPKNSGRSYARNRGLEVATGDIIIFSDSDMIPEKDFIDKHFSHHTKGNSIFVCGSFWNKIYTNYYNSQDITLKESLNKLNKEYKNFLTLDLEKKLKQLFIDNKLSGFSSRQSFSDWYEWFFNEFGTNLEGFKFQWMYFIVMNVSFKMSDLLNVGFFDEDFTGWGGEDEEVGYKLWKSGVKGVVDPTIKNYHQEHPRSKQTEHIEHKKNLQYILKKHQDIAPLVFYTKFNVDHLKRNQMLFELDDVCQKKIVSTAFKDNVLLLFLYLNNLGKAPQTLSLKHDLQKLQKSRKYNALVNTVQLAVKNIN